MQVTKAISLQYHASQALSSLFEKFRLMCNDAIRIAMKVNPKNRFKLIELAYHRLKEYGLHSHYILSACEVAFTIYRNHNNKDKSQNRNHPYVRKPFIKLDNQTYLLNHCILRIPSTPRHFIYLTLRASYHHLSLIGEKTLKKGSVTITYDKVAIAISKMVDPGESHGKMGIDVNERNVTWADSTGRVQREDTSEVAELKKRYKEARARIASRTTRDRRIMRALLSKYGKREKDRTIQRIHLVTKKIVEAARINRLCIVMESLKGIRKLYRKRNGQGRSYRGRLNSWTFREIQRQIQYKASWNGVLVAYVNPRGTSSKCPNCGSSLVNVEARRLMCRSCRKTEDRDVIASKNIMACARSVPQARPSE